MGTWKDYVVGLLATAFFGIFGWAFNLNGRLVKLETRDTDIAKLLEVQFAGVNQRLDRIERNQNGKNHD